MLWPIHTLTLDMIGHFKYVIVFMLDVYIVYAFMCIHFTLHKAEPPEKKQSERLPLNKIQRCKYCGYIHLQCSTMSSTWKDCRGCRKLNHLKVICKSADSRRRAIHELKQNTVTDKQVD